MTTSFCVVGSPIEHSLSPVLHSAAYKQLGLAFEYVKSDVPLGGLASFLAGGMFTGVSVTMPLKKEAFDLGAAHDKYSLVTEVANTLFQKDGNWSAANTDVYGITKALETVVSPRKTVLIGSGATSRSALVALAENFPETEISLVSRNQEAAIELASFAESLGFISRIQAATAKEILDADLVMSLVPAGSYGELWAEVSLDSKSKSGVLFDVAYNPWPSTVALAWGSARVISGIEMLLWQAVEQVEHFVAAAGVDKLIDRDMLYEVMKKAVSGK